MTAGDLAAAIDEFGATPTDPPSGWTETVTVTRIDDSEPAAFHAAVPLWTVEEGRSDLTLELEVKEFVESVFAIEILDLHVL